MCAASLVLLGLLGAIGWGLSDAPAVAAFAGGVAWVVGGAWLARRELRRPVRRLVLGADRRGELDGRPVDTLHVDWRGPLYLVTWREDGRRGHWFAFPDVLDVGSRRELRLWAPPGA